MNNNTAKLEKAMKRRDLAKAKLETVLLEKKLERFKAKYDVVDNNNSRKRRETTVETQT
mgnify:CR=1 FL=1